MGRPALELHEIARWSAWPSLLCYTVAIGLRIGSRPADWKVISQKIWATGWILLVLHVLIAMSTVHHWSVSEAYTHTARQTFAAVGWDWGGGVYLNFATVGIWGWTVLAMSANATSKRAIPVEPIAQWYLAFMMFNATVVFGSRPAQVVGVLMCIGLAWRFLTPERPR